MAVFQGLSYVDGTSDADRIVGTKDDDILRGGQGDDFISGNAGNDFLRGGAGNDILFGGNGMDRLEGANDADMLFGGRDADELFGGNGNDVLSGDFGADLLVGGAGSDLFYFSKQTAGQDGDGGLAFDTIRDFTAGDEIHFDKYDAATKLIFQQNGAHTLIYVDLQGDGIADYLAADVRNATVALVEAGTSFGDMIL